MTRLPEGKTRLDLVRERAAAGTLTDAAKRGRMFVGIDRLVEDPRNERRTFTGMEGLTESVKAVGLIEPITVTPAGERFQIVTGHRRYRAARNAGLTQVEILIRDPEDEFSRRQKSLISNIQREQISPVEMAEALASMLAEHPAVRTQRDLAALIGKNEAWVSGMLRVLDLPPNLQKKLGSPQVSVGYDAMVRVARLSDTRIQTELVDAIVAGVSGREIRGRIEEGRGKSATSNAADATKPKRVFYTSHNATVIVQGRSMRLDRDDVVAALQEAVSQARKMPAD